MSGRQSELDRLQLQSRVWEPAGERLLQRLGDGSGLRAVDIGCGVMGWLRALARWVGPVGSVVGTDSQPEMLAAASEFLAAEGIENAELVEDDLFSTSLPAASFDLVHARFELAPLGRFEEQMETYRRLVRPGGVIVLEDPDSASWHFVPEAPAAQRLIRLIEDAFQVAGGDLNAGRRIPQLLGQGAELSAELIALPAGHPYLRLPLQFAASLEARLHTIASASEVAALRSEAEVEIADPGRWGFPFTLVQGWKRF